MVDYQYYGDNPSQPNKPADLSDDDEFLDSDENEKVVLDSVDITVVECPDCNRPLLNLLKVSYDDSKITKVQVKCIDKNCGGSSWVHTIKGDYRFSAIKSRDYVNSVEEMDN